MDDCLESSYLVPDIHDILCASGEFVWDIVFRALRLGHGVYKDVQGN